VRASPQIPAEFGTRFEARISQDAPHLVDSIALQPSLITESAAIGQRWGMRIGAEIGASLQQKVPQ
jgi:hypothetical protein